MAKPILSKIPIFNASDGVRIEFVYTGEVSSLIATISGGELSGSFEEIVLTISSVPGSSIRKTFYLNSESLTNTKSPYSMSIKILDHLGKASSESDMVIFYCKEKPDFAFDGLSADAVNPIDSQVVLFNLHYNNISDESETLKSYCYYLYDEKKKIIKQSKTYYGNISKTFIVDGFENEKTYYVRALGESVNGYVFDTGFIELYTSYLTDRNYLLLNVENRYRDADIVAKTHIASVDGFSEDKIEYVERSSGNYAVNLLNNEVVSYTLPYEVDFYRIEDYDLRVIVKPVIGENIITICDKDGNEFQVLITKRAFTDISGDTEEKLFCIMRNSDYVAESNQLSANTETEYYEVNIKRENGLYQIQLIET